MWVALLGQLPTNSLALVFNDALALGDGLQGEDTLAMHAGATGLDTAARLGNGILGHC